MTMQVTRRTRQCARMSSMMLRSLGLLLCVLMLAFPSAGPAQAQVPDMTYVGLNGHGLYAMGIAPDGRIVLGTSNGIWQATADGQGVSQWSGVGLPVASCSAAGAPTDGSEPCFVPSLAVNSRGDVFAVVSPGWKAGRLYRWRAAGESWEVVPDAQMMLKGDDQVGRVAVAPDDTLYATRSFWYYGTRAAVFRSTDDGELWSEVRYAGDAYWETVDAMAVGPTGQVWLGGGNLGGAHWMRVSSDGGTTWATSTVIPPTADQLTDSHTTTDFAFSDQGDVYVTTAGGAGDYPLGVYSSPDQGSSWQRLTPADIPQELAAIALSGDNHICYGNHGAIMCSSDAGMSWAALTFPVDYPATFVTDLLVDYGGYLWATTDSRGLSGRSSSPGLYRSALPVGSGPQPPAGPE